MEVEEVNEEETEITELLVRHSCVYLIDHLSFWFFYKTLALSRWEILHPLGPVHQWSRMKVTAESKWSLYPKSVVVAGGNGSRELLKNRRRSHGQSQL